MTPIEKLITLLLSIGSVIIVFTYIFTGLSLLLISEIAVFIMAMVVSPIAEMKNESKD